MRNVKRLTLWYVPFFMGMAVGVVLMSSPTIWGAIGIFAVMFVVCLAWHYFLDWYESKRVWG